MDVLLALWPGGNLAASTFDRPAGYGEQFRASFEARGFTVTRMTEAARLLQLEQGRRQAREVVVEGESREETALPPLPEVGQPVQHREFGAGVVVYHLVMPTGPVAVGRGAGWEGLLLEGYWSLATATQELTQEAPKSPTLQAPNSQGLQVPDSELPQLQPLPLPTQMPLLFGDL